MTQTPGTPDQPDYLDAIHLEGPVAAGPASGPPTRRAPRRVLFASVGAVVAVVIAVVLLVTVVFGGDGGGSSSSDGSLVPSNARALSAVVIDHLPAGATVMWATGDDNTGDVMKSLSRSAGAALNGAVSSTVLVRAGGHQYMFSVVSSDGTDGAALNTTVIPSRDSQGRLTSLMAMAQGSTGTRVVLEIAGPGGAGVLPMDESAVRALVTDPRAGSTTTSEMMQRGKDLASFSTNPPPIQWPHSPI